MKIIKMLSVIILLGFGLGACSQAKNQQSSDSSSTNVFTAGDYSVTVDSSGWNELTAEEEKVIVYKGTEMIWKGEYTDNHEKGTYLCKRCNAPLFESESKFDSGSGWPAFDSFIGESVTEIPDKDGYRVEIVCTNCQGHLGHVFKGERFTDKNTRHCVNSISMQFVKE